MRKLLSLNVLPAMKKTLFGNIKILNHYLKNGNENIKNHPNTDALCAYHFFRGGGDADLFIAAFGF